MKRFFGYLTAMLLILVTLAIVDVAAFAVIYLKTGNTKGKYDVENVSRNITYDAGGYMVDASAEEWLDVHSSFAMIIGEDGDIVWEYAMPEDVPEHYDLKDVASFSHWYLADYPVFTRIRDDGILVLGLPKGSVWKYSVDFNTATVEGLFGIIPYMAVVNAVILIVLPILITRRWLNAKERSRTEWIAGVSHDIRTPLSLVLGSVEKGSVAEQQCLRMRDLIGNLNTVNKLDAGTGKWDDMKVAVVPLLREIVCDYINSYGNHYVFEADIDECLEDFSVNADATLLRRMIDNLITNSVLHNAGGCTIKITLSSPEKQPDTRSMWFRKRGAVLTICDNGNGADEDRIKALNAKVKSNYLPEHGLGLRVVKEVARKYKYPIRFSSVPSKYFKCEITVH